MYNTCKEVLQFCHFFRQNREKVPILSVALLCHVRYDSFSSATYENLNIFLDLTYFDKNSYLI